MAVRDTPDSESGTDRERRFDDGAGSVGVAGRSGTADPPASRVLGGDRTVEGGHTPDSELVFAGSSIAGSAGRETHLIPSYISVEWIEDASTEPEHTGFRVSSAVRVGLRPFLTGGPHLVPS